MWQSGGRARDPIDLRRMLQLGIVALAATAGVRLATGRSMDGVELFCPFGGLETAYSLFGRQTFTCATGAGNFALFVALIALTVLARKAFCSWVCPVGTVAEGLAHLGGWVRRSHRRAFGRASRRADRRATGPPTSGSSRPPRPRRLRHRLGLYEPPTAVDRALRWMRLPVLVLILAFTWRTGELVFRPYDPYYVLFSMNGHDVQPFSYAIVAALLLAGSVIPMAWCRYLCPLGITLTPFGRWGALRIRRTGAACNGCGRCEQVCPQSLPVAQQDEIRSGECTMCLECTRACPRSGALALHAPRPASTWSPFPIRRSLPEWTIPVLIAVLAVLGIGGAKYVRVPSYVLDYPSHAAVAGTGGSDVSPSSLASVRMVIDGVKCVDTAERAARQLSHLEGVHRFMAYASAHEAVITFDPTKLDAAAISAAIESPYHDPVDNRFLFHLFEVVEIDEERSTK